MKTCLSEARWPGRVLPALVMLTLGMSTGSVVGQGRDESMSVFGCSKEEYLAMPREQRLELLRKRRERRAAQGLSASESSRTRRARQLVEQKRTEFESARPQVVDSRTVMRTSEPPDSLRIDLGNGVKLDMVGIGAGTFVMGSPRLESLMSGLVGHKVTLLDSFWIGKFELTRAQYAQVLGTDGGTPGMSDYPMSGISWDDAIALTERLNEKFGDGLPEGYSFSLPTSAQWEFACRAGCASDLSNGCALEGWQRKKFDLSHRMDAVPALDEVAWYCANASNVPHRVGLKKPNAWGLYDMHGNVEEWCLDWAGDPHDPLRNLYYANNVFDQQGPETGTRKILRGGSILGMPGMCASFSSNLAQPGDTNRCRGVRIVISRPAHELPDFADDRLYGVWTVHEDMEFLNHLHEEAEASKKRYEAAVSRHRELKLEIEQAKRKSAILEALTIVMYAAKPFVEFQVNRGARAAMGEKVGKPWDGFGDKLAEDWGLSDGETNNGPANANIAHGFGVIKGRSSLKQGETSTYTLYIGGRKVQDGVSWTAAGTSISVNNCGDYARAMAGNPPVRGGSFKTGVKAVYGGKTYTKWISIQKKR